MSSIFENFTQGDLNKMSWEDADKLLWMITRAGIVQDLDWGEQINPEVKKHVREWCKAVGVKYDKELEGDKMIKQARVEAVKVAKKAEKEAVEQSESEEEEGEKEWHDGLKLDDLKQICKDEGVKGYSGKSKDKVIELITEKRNAPEDAEDDETEKAWHDGLKLDDLKKICKDEGVKGFSGKNKDKVIELITEKRNAPEETEPAPKKKAAKKAKKSEPEETDIAALEAKLAALKMAKKKPEPEPEVEEEAEDEAEDEVEDEVEDEAEDEAEDEVDDLDDPPEVDFEKVSKKKEEEEEEEVEDL